MPLNKEMVNWIINELNTRPSHQGLNGEQAKQHAMAHMMIEKELQAIFPDDPKPNLQVVPAPEAKLDDAPPVEPGDVQIG